jgi:acyl-CoA reductase-like NAD-dependent aldehyde dehydrogenase
MTTFNKVYINGDWTAPSGSGSIPVYDSITEGVLGEVPAGDAQDVARAATAARTAFTSWSTLPNATRADYMDAIGDGLAARMDEIAEVISRETGMNAMLSKLVQVGLPINSFKQAAAQARTFEFEETVGSSLVVREPIGVVGCITPWNYPLHQIAAKIEEIKEHAASLYKR